MIITLMSTENSIKSLSPLGAFACTGPIWAGKDLLVSWRCLQRKNERGQRGIGVSVHS